MASPHDRSRREGGSPARPRRKVRSWWLKQLHAWHWVSAAVSLAGTLLFAVTGLTLNHAASIKATPHVAERAGQLSRPLLARLSASRHAPDAALPDEVAAAVAIAVGLDPAGRAAEWNADDVYVAMPGPGSDAWISIDRASGRIAAERTERGLVSYLNDLHKGRNTGPVWFWFIDGFAVACILFTLTGLLLLQLHARHRPATWPLVGLGIAIPFILAILFLH